MLRPSARCASAIRVSVPPSPLLSARSRISTYFSVTMMISAQKISERTPSTAALRHLAAGRRGDDRFAEGVERAGADVAIDDADAADGEGPEAGVRDARRRSRATRKSLPWGAVRD